MPTEIPIPGCLAAVAAFVLVPALALAWLVWVLS